MKAEHAPRFSIPLAVTMVAVAAASILSLAVLVAARSTGEAPWPVVAGLLCTLAALSWAGLFHAVGTRRTFRGCALHLETVAVRPGELTSFAISDPHRKLRSTKALGITLAWRETSTRVGGRKVYTEGPYELSSTVHWELRDAPLSAGPSLTGEFRVAQGEIRLTRLEEWKQRVEILVRVRTGQWRSCSFVLPFEEQPGGCAEGPA